MWCLLPNLTSFPPVSLLCSLQYMSSHLGHLIVSSKTYPSWQQRNLQSSAYWPFVLGIGSTIQWIPLMNGQQCGKCFHVMSSSWVFYRVGQCHNNIYLYWTILPELFRISIMKFWLLIVILRSFLHRFRIDEDRHQTVCTKTAQVD